MFLERQRKGVGLDGQAPDAHVALAVAADEHVALRSYGQRQYRCLVSVMDDVLLLAASGRKCPDCPIREAAQQLLPILSIWTG